MSGTGAGAARPRFLRALRFDQLTPLYDPLVALTTRERRFKKRLIRQASIAAGMRVLDVGCGTGTLALLAERAAADVAVTGLDADPRILTLARAKGARSGVRVRFDEGMSFALPYADGSFDRVLSSLFFHHLSPHDKLRTAREIARVLAPGGELHVADWGRPHNPAMRALSVLIRVLDGVQRTRDNLAGRLPAIFEAGGFRDAGETGLLATPFGTLSLYRARR